VSDDDWLGDSRSVSPDSDNEEKKKRLTEYMSQGSGAYKAEQKLK
jgi:hypothetical protein